jgi:hypothetical protein
VAPYFRLPLQKDVAEGFLAPHCVAPRGHLVDEHVADAWIEHASFDPGLAEDRDRQAQPEQNARLQVVPRRRDADRLVLPLLFRRSGLADAVRYSPTSSA